MKKSDRGMQHEGEQSLKGAMAATAETQWSCTRGRRGGRQGEGGGLVFHRCLFMGYGGTSAESRGGSVPASASSAHARFHTLSWPNP